MTISFASAQGNLLNRLGSLGGLVENLKAYQSTQLTAMTDTTTGVVAEYNSESDIQAVMGSAYIGVLSSTDSIIGSVVQNIANLTISRMVFRDNPQLNQTLTSTNTLASLLEIIRQMKLAGATVLAMTVTATPASFIGTGNGIVTASVRRPKDGKVLENSFAENLLFTCTEDSYLGNAQPGNESFAVTGTGQQQDVFAFDWPLGSNCQIGIQAIDGNTSDGAGNILTNTGFSNWTANIPNNFALVEGIAGTNIFQETTIVLDDSSSSLAIVGDVGGTLTQLRQQFDNSGGTTGQLEPLTQYSVNLFARRDGIAPGTGILTVELVDEDLNVIQDEDGNDNTFDVNLTTLSTVFLPRNGVFRTPAAMPDVYYIRARLSTALTNGRTVYIDKMSLGQMTQTYVSGPFVAVHSSRVNFVQGDTATCAITNGRGVGGTLSTWQTLLSQLFPDIMTNELLFPSSGTPSISDGLIG